MTYRLAVGKAIGVETSRNLEGGERTRDLWAS